MDVRETISWLTNKPSSTVIANSRYFMNGFKFGTKDCESNHVTQNSGANVSAPTFQVSGSKENNPHTGVMEYYGVLAEIWELQYLMTKRVIFKCD